MSNTSAVFTKVNGTELFYEVDGEGPPCIVLHGGLGLDHLVYRRTLQPLADEMSLVFMDIRGNGQSDRSGISEMTMETMADDVVGLADHLDINEFTVFGHSYGGFIAQEVMLRHPRRVSGAMLISTRPGQLGENESADEHPIPPRPDAFLELPPPHDDRSCGLYWADAAPYFTNSGNVAELKAALDGTKYCNDALFHSDEIYNTWSSIDRLRSAQTPSFVLVGSQDVICSPPDSRRIAQRLPNATYFELPDANHFPWIEQPGFIL